MAIMAVWAVLYLIGLRVDLMTPLAGRGLALTGRAYYRFVTGPLLHFGLVHLLANMSALFWVGYYLETPMGSLRFLLFTLLAGTLSAFCYACLFPLSRDNIGGSVWIFALFGLIAAYQLWRPGFPRFRLGTWYGNWLAIYAVLGNLPLLPFFSAGTVYTHLISLATGFALGALGIFLKLL